MKKLDLVKKILCLFLCLIILWSALPISELVYAEESEFYPTSEEGQESIDNMFDIKVKDLTSLNKILYWLTKQETFVIVRAKESGEIEKVYVNVPSLPQIVKNELLKVLSDGWETDMYTPEDGILLKGIGLDETTGEIHQENALTKFGYNLTVPTYKGEYPKIFMSLTNIIPTTTLQLIWRTICSIFGYGFIQAPDIDNFKTLYYYNHTYFNTEQEKFIQFINKYWSNNPTEVTIVDDLFWRGEGWTDDNCDTAYFSSHGQVNTMKVYEATGRSATTFIESHREKKEQLEKIRARRVWWEENCQDEESYGGYGRYIDSADTVEVENAQGAQETIITTYFDENEPIDEEFQTAMNEYEATMTQYHNDKARYDNGELPEGYKSKLIPAGTEFPVVGNPHKVIVIDYSYYEFYDATGKRVPDPRTGEPPTRPTRPDWTEYRDKNHNEDNYPDLSPEDLAFLQEYAENEAIVNKWENFKELMRHGTKYGSSTAWKNFLGKDSHKKYLYYSQCLLNKSSGDDDAYDDTRCETTYNGQKYSGDMMTLFIETGVYKMDGSTRQGALKIISTLQSRLGPAYDDMMSNFLVCVQAAYAAREVEIDDEIFIDPRVMPYDIDTLVSESDKNMINISDPRVDIYKKNIIGTALLGGDLTLSGNLFAKKTIANFFINKLGGTVSKLTVTLAQLTNLEWFENHGLSPVTIWEKLPSTLLVLLLSLIIIIQVIQSAWKFINGSGGIGQLIGRFVLFLLFVALICAFTLPSLQNKTWTTIKKVFNASSSLIETTYWENEGAPAELLGDKTDGAVAYYIPYFNLWTKYMTGYTITDEQQILDINSGEPEVNGLVDEETKEILLPKINGEHTKLWSVVLADSFNSLGENHTIFDSTNQITYGTHTIYVNGQQVNSNAYRVVDHFMAPRLVTTITSDGYANIENTVNPNYNEKFQKLNLLGMIGDVLLLCNLFLVVLIKFLVFLWFWWMLYLFAFSVVLDAVQRRGNTKNIIISTIMPLVYLPLLGGYAVLIMSIGMHSTGIVNILLNLTLFIVTFVIINYWHSSRYFPKTLEVLYMVTKITTWVKTQKLNLTNATLDNVAERFPEVLDDNGNIDYTQLIDAQGNRKMLDNKYDELYYLLHKKAFNAYSLNGETEQAISNEFGEYGDRVVNYCKNNGLLNDYNNTEIDPDDPDKEDRLLSFKNKNYGSLLDDTYDKKRNHFKGAYDKDDEDGNSKYLNKNDYSSKSRKKKAKEKDRET